MLTQIRICFLVKVIADRGDLGHCVARLEALTLEIPADVTISKSTGMKIHIGIDCTPAEARAFFGLPDVKPLQDHLLQDVEERLRTSLKIIDVDHLLRTWLPSGLHGLEKVQSTMWSQFIASMGGGRNPADDSADEPKK